MCEKYFLYLFAFPVINQWIFPSFSDVLWGFNTDSNLVNRVECEADSWVPQGRDTLLWGFPYTENLEINCSF